MVRPRPDDLDEGLNWIGGFYELAIELGNPDDARLDEALKALWEAAGATGPFGGYYRNELAIEVPLELASLERHGHIRGIVDVPRFGAVVAGAVALRYQSDPDWLIFYIPMGALGHADPRVGGFPLGSAAPAAVWRVPLDAWFAHIGERVFSKVRFVRAAIGFEASGDEFEGDGHLVPAGDIVEYVPGRMDVDVMTFDHPA